MARPFLISVTLILVIMGSACGSGGEEDISGPWELVSATGSGVRYTPDPNDDAPWIQVRPEVEGDTGCNAIRPDGPPPQFVDGHLSKVSSMVQAVGCDGTVAAIEAILLATLWHEDGISVTLLDDGDTMRWESPEGFVIDFVRR